MAYGAPEAPVEPWAGGGATYVDVPPELLDPDDDDDELDFFFFFDFFFVTVDDADDDADELLALEDFVDDPDVPVTMASACFFSDATVLRRLATCAAFVATA